MLPIPKEDTYNTIKKRQKRFVKRHDKYFLLLFFVAQVILSKLRDGLLNNCNRQTMERIDRNRTVDHSKICTLLNKERNLSRLKHMKFQMSGDIHIKIVL